MVNKNYPYYIFISGLMISRSMSIPQKDSYSSIVDRIKFIRYDQDVAF